MTRTETLHTLFAKLPEPNQAFKKLLEEKALQQLMTYAHQFIQSL
ncbi:hypothetical protein [Empedobacter brevis]|nr:hypothetical protein [Empedobacter brevis]